MEEESSPVHLQGRMDQARETLSTVFFSLSHSSLVVFQNIIHSAAPMGDEMAHHLYVLQALTLGLLEPRIRTPLDPYSQV